ncbi:DUF29 domain-containing protein [Gloeocapsa sp. PCC 73106]|uniref:DUF29 domain-containing protein n=1 Tax=Gloeocapsa sp. PCC 73106 TaxID=102232 RepID=UPI0002AC4F9A|nr:DUF29 domain-containing protein [Gloeocapsa sp. PCC 73106]ELR98654.1 protein of unknown function DUF29 [Gloeocapsa sp. PCC 73106]
MSTITDLKTLYINDFSLWLETTARLLRERKLEQIDYDNLIEEIESVGRVEKNALKSNLRILLMHLLKWKYQSSQRSNSSRYSISEHSLRILDLFKDSPSLKGYFDDILSETYQDARLLVFRETGLSKDMFPTECPFTIQDLLNPEYLP